MTLHSVRVRKNRVEHDVNFHKWILGIEQIMKNNE